MKCAHTCFNQWMKSCLKAIVTILHINGFWRRRSFFFFFLSFYSNESNSILWLKIVIVVSSPNALILGTKYWQKVSILKCLIKGILMKDKWKKLVASIVRNLNRFWLKNKSVQLSWIVWMNELDKVMPWTLFGGVSLKIDTSSEFENRSIHLNCIFAVKH